MPLLLLLPRLLKVLRLLLVLLRLPLMPKKQKLRKRMPVRNNLITILIKNPVCQMGFFFEKMLSTRILVLELLKQCIVPYLS
jgi:hypothetical protein